MQGPTRRTFHLLAILLISSHFVNGVPRKPTSGVVTSNRFPTSDEDEDVSEPFEDDARVYKNPRNSPSAMCPRDEEQAELLGQKCLRKCSSDEDCKSKKKKCLCDGACGMSCIKPDRECDEVPPPSLGRVRVTGRLFGDRAIYSCDKGSGARLVGMTERTCQADGQWSGSPPVCNKDVFCGEAPTINFARHTAPPVQRSFTVDTTLQYQCQPGYTTSGFPHAKCLALDGSASWFGPDMKCEPRSCGPPLGVEHGWTEGDCHTFNCHVQYHCAVGFELTGGRGERVCHSDGSWNPRELPSCVPVQCPIPKNPANGKAIYTSCAYNSVVSYECKFGYRLVGEPSRRCGPDKQWTGDAPICKENPSCRPEDATGARCTPGEPGCSYAKCQQEVNCGHPGVLYNGWLEGIEEGTMLGASIIFQCHEGMTLVGNTSTVCQLDGTWRYPLPKCLAPCVVPTVHLGRVLGNASMGPVVPHGYRLEVECADRYEFSPHTAHVLCNNGTWTHVAKCEPARCKHLPKAPRNGMVIAPKTEHSMRARFKCKDGYTIKGATTAVCQFGNWTGEQPYCQEVYCPFPGYIENGKVMLVGNMGLYDYRPYVRKVTNNKQIMYDCVRGYVLADGPVGATCIGGRWSPKDLPRCVPGQHPRLRWSRETREKRSTDPAMEALERRWMALQRAKRSPILSLMLPRFYHDQWRSLPTPEKKTRSKRETTPDMDYPSLPAAPDYTDVMDYADEENWMDRMQAAQAHSKTVATKTVASLDKKGKGKKGNRNKSNSRTGNRGNRNKGGAIKKATCEALPEAPYIEVILIKQGHDANLTNTLGAVVKLECTQGFSPTLGNRTARCVRGNWKPSKPDCIIMNCKVPEINSGRYTLHGNVVLPEAEVKTFETIELGCNRGYNMQGPTSLYCLHGNWTNPNFPSCQPAPCRLSTFKNGQFLGGYRAGLTIAHGATVNYQCEPEYSRNPPAAVECLHGELRPRPPSCRIKGATTTIGAGMVAAGAGAAAGLGAGLGGIMGSNYNPSGALPDIDYKGGSDITRGGAIGGAGPGGVLPSPAKKSPSRGQPCGPPARVEGSLVYRNGIPLAPGDLTFNDTTEITFDCIASIMGEKTTWKIICEDGSWVGRSLNCASTEDYGELDFSTNQSCVFRNTEPNLIYFFNDQPITDEMVEFPPGTELVARCADIGKYSMIGSNTRRCQTGEWDGQKPVCFGLNQENEYALEKPPTILFRHQLGPIAQSNDGKLIVYPGTILHMECLWIRRFGTPKWTVSHSYRKYPEGWVTDPSRDSQLEYRLSIFHASRDDSGTFTCVTPTRHTHNVEIIVKAVHCPMLTPRRHMTISSQNTKLNSHVSFACQNGNTLIGTEEITCLPSGNWSAPVPVCESIECGDFMNITDPHLRVTIQSREVGGRAVFTCAQGFGLRGANEALCLPSGEWSGSLPTCSEVQCEPPDTPENGYIQGHGVYKAGDVIQFNCNPEFMMEGQPIIACQETGRWSGTVPKCVQACSYPGTTISGRMSSVKFYYKIGETVTFSCDDGLELRGAPMLRCLRSGKWSTSIPTCITKT